MVHGIHQRGGTDREEQKGAAEGSREKAGTSAQQQSLTLASVASLIFCSALVG